MEQFTLNAEDGTALAGYAWPVDQPKAVVQISHGMAEHAQRYDGLARRLNTAGFAVYAHDHRGHGQTSEHGHFADHDGWDQVVADLGAVTQHVRSQHPGVPVFLLGHSMGSLLARSFAIRHTAPIDGLILSGTAGGQGALGEIGQRIALTQSRFRGSSTPSKLMDRLTFGQYNAAFKPTRTDFDWLSRDPDAVDAYVADPACGFVCSAGFFADLLGGLKEINDVRNVARIDRQLPILILSGELDPVGGRNLKLVRAVAQQFHDCAIADVTCKTYPGARHEIFNEINRDEVMGDVIVWINHHLPGVN